MRRLREPEQGCPWDLQQNFRSIAPYTIEEAYEVADAIERGALDELADELGDLLLQVVYHAQMAAEAGDFGWDDVVGAICAKMIRRHPHVFGNMARDEFTTGSWERMKAQERAARGDRRESALDGVPAPLPGMTRAVKLQDRAARVGFDWPDTGGVLEKIVEEAGELAEARETRDRDQIEAEYGDLLFVIANLGRHLRIDPEAALRRVNAKFERRFRGVEAALAAEGRGPADATLAEMDAIWTAIKRRE
ncbi:nucleoside triphosphate pyrophosphohydrolase [Pikeienuella piscinae]|uniref:Nucleoside triphosphate pyrophosphohydrolase n=1 Tax=Pikeienuella piscinae TaxID=2748098 RepID=A0A7L5BSL8_9RHOB|nr:nucleoside triphosphate pyrophosphohydrolase [Pikeienuella piscinae]QIE54490.1 nucleoside triphosphate pyrophosphohydrolase [Pikeienuella piscinae]